MAHTFHGEDGWFAISNSDLSGMITFGHHDTMSRMQVPGDFLIALVKRHAINELIAQLEDVELYGAVKLTKGPTDENG